jgi:transposase-like protein
MKDIWTRHEQFCHNPACPDRGQSGGGNIRIDSRQEQRYRGSGWGRSFAATTGTPFSGLRMAPEGVTRVVP